jgi:predicted MFS family arabinose efflux permease
MFAVVAGVSVANIYYIQPLLNMVRDQLGLTDFSADLIALASQVGYAAGLFLIMPLGDLLQRRHLVLANISVAMVALVVIALSPSYWLVVVASLACGACSVTPQIFVPLVGQCSHPRDKDRNVGIVISGLLVGIIGSRVLSGTFGHALGWHNVFFIAAALMVACDFLMLAFLPRAQSNFQGGWRQLMRSLLALPRRFPKLMVYALRYAFCFASLLAMWTTLTFKLGLPPFNAPASIIGALGLCGVVGALTASFIGRYIKRVGVRRFSLIGCGCQLLAWLSFWLGQSSYIGIICGIVLLDIGMQCIQLSNQTHVMALDPSSSSRINTIYMTTGFIGGALGTLGAGWAWGAFAWAGVVSCGTLLVLAALCLVIFYKH